MSRNNTYVLLVDGSGGERHRLMHEGGSAGPGLTGAVIVDAMLGLLEAPPKARTGFALLAHLAASKDASIRREALRFLGDLEPREAAAVPLLVKALDDTEGRSSAARAATRSLEHLGPLATPALPKLIAIVRAREPRSPIRQEALIALGAIDPKGAQVLPVLIEALADADPAARIGSALALRRMHPASDPVVPALIQAIETSSTRSVRFYLVQALQAQGPRADAALPLLRELAANPEPPRDNKGRVTWDVESAAQAAIRVIERAPKSGPDGK